uniref:Polyprotein n=2 Tax=unclassified Benyviridae TaxID=2364280 RepID=A0AAU6NDX0_9VIRU
MTPSLFPCSMVGPDDCWGCMHHRQWEDAWTEWFDTLDPAVQEDKEQVAKLFGDSWHALIIPQGSMLHVEAVDSKFIPGALSFSQIASMSPEQVASNAYEYQRKQMLQQAALEGNFKKIMGLARPKVLFSEKRVTLAELLISSDPVSLMKVGSAAEQINKAMEINGPTIAAAEATIQFNQEVAAMPNIPYIMSNAEKTRFSEYVGKAIRTLGRKCSWNDHLFLESSRHLIREQLQHLFPHNTDYQSVLHVGATATDVSQWFSHAGHDFQFAMKDDKDMSRILEEVCKKLAQKLSAAVPPALKTFRNSSVNLHFDGLNDLLATLGVGDRDRFIVGTDQRPGSVLPAKCGKYNVLMFEDCLYDMSASDFAAYWERTGANIGYATMFFPHAMIDPNVERSPLYEYSEYFDPWVTANWLADRCWPSILAFSWALPIKGMARLLYEALKGLSGTGWNAFKDWVSAIKRDEFPVQLMAFSVLDVYKFIPIIRQVFENCWPIFRKYCMRAKVYWRGGVSNGYDHTLRTWESWLKTPRIDCGGFFVDSEITTRIGEMYLIKFWKSNGASPIVRSLQLPIELDYVRLANLEKSWDSVHSVFRPFEYVSFRAQTWHEMLNWCLAQPAGSLDFAVIQNAVNRTSKGFSVGANILAAAAPHDRKDNSILALCLLMETFKRRNVIKEIETDEDLRDGYRTQLSVIAEKVAKLGFAVFTGGIGVAAWYLYRYLTEKVANYDYVIYSSPVNEIHVKGIGNAKPRVDSGPLRIVVPPLKTEISASCTLCDFRMKGWFSANGEPDDGQKFHLSKHDVDNKIDLSLSENDVSIAIAKVRDAKSWHLSKGADKLAATINKFCDWLETQKVGISQEVKIEHIRGGPGSGKSEVIKALAYRLEKQGVSVAITMPFSDLCTEYNNAKVLGVNSRHDFKADTTWYTLNRSNINTLIVDEATGVDWLVLKAICSYLSVRTIYLVGDRGQTHLRAEAGEGIDPTSELSGLDWSRVPEHELVYNFRLGAWRTKMLNAKYGYRMISKRSDDDRPMFVSRDEYVHIKEATVVDREMVFTHNSALQCFGTESSSDKGVCPNMSVRSSQGLTVDRSAVGVTGLDVGALDVMGFVVVAMTRSKKAPYIVYPEGDDTEAVGKLKEKIDMVSEDQANAIFNLPWPDLPTEKADPEVKPEFRALNQRLEQMKHNGKVNIDPGYNDEFEYRQPQYVGRRVEIEDAKPLPLDVVNLVQLYKEEFHWCFFDALAASRSVTEKALLNFSLSMAEQCFYNDGMMARPARDKSARIRGPNSRPLPVIAVKVKDTEGRESWVTRRLMPLQYLVDSAFRRLGVSIVVVDKKDSVVYQTIDLRHKNSRNNSAVVMRMSSMMATDQDADKASATVGHVFIPCDKEVRVRTGTAVVRQPIGLITYGTWIGDQPVEDKAYVLPDEPDPGAVPGLLTSVMSGLSPSLGTNVRNRGDDDGASSVYETANGSEVVTLRSVVEGADPLLQPVQADDIVGLPQGTLEAARIRDLRPKDVSRGKTTSALASWFKHGDDDIKPVGEVSHTSETESMVGLIERCRRLAGDLISFDDAGPVDTGVAAAVRELVEAQERELSESSICKGCRRVLRSINETRLSLSVFVGAFMLNFIKSGVALVQVGKFHILKFLHNACATVYKFFKWRHSVLAELPGAVIAAGGWLSDSLEACFPGVAGVYLGPCPGTDVTGEPSRLREEDFPPDGDFEEIGTVADRLEANAAIIEQMRNNALAGGPHVGVYLEVETNSPSGVPVQTKDGRLDVKHLWKRQDKLMEGAIYNQDSNLAPDKTELKGHVVICAAPYSGKTTCAKSSHRIIDMDLVLANSGVLEDVPDGGGDWGEFNRKAEIVMKAKLKTLPAYRHVVLVGHPYWAERLKLPLVGKYRVGNLRHVPMAERNSNRDNWWKESEHAGYKRIAAGDLESICLKHLGKKSDRIRRSKDELHKPEFGHFVDPEMPEAHRVRAAEVVDSFGQYVSKDWKPKPDLPGKNMDLRGVGKDTYKLHDFVAPRTLEDGPMLNEAGPVQGMTRLNNMETDWGNTFHQVTKSGVARPYQDVYVRSIGHGLANFFGTSTAETMLASQRIGQLRPKPRLDSEKLAWAKAVAAKVVQDCWKLTPLSIEEHNAAIKDAWADARRRNYGPRSDAEYRRSMGEPTLMCANKAQQKPIKNDKLDILKPGQLIVQSPPDVNLKFIAMHRIFGRTLKASCNDWFFMDDYEDPDSFNARLTQAIRDLPSSASFGIMDFTEFDSQQNDVTLAIEKEVCRLMGVPVAWSEEYYAYRSKGLKVSFPGLFKLKMNQEKPSGFLDTKSGNTILSCALATWLFDYKGPRVHAAKGDDTLFVASSLGVKRHRAAEVSKYTGMSYKLDIDPDGGEFIGCVVSRGGLFKSITRTAMKSICKPAKDYEQFKEQQKALRDALNSWRVGGLDETIANSALAEGKSVEYVKLCYDFVVSWSSISREQWLECTKARKMPRFNIRTAEGPDLLA